MTSRERLAATLRHEEPDRLCVDFGATPVTGMHVAVVDRLRRAVLGEAEWRVRVCEPFQMLGEIDDRLRAALGIDTLGVYGRTSLLGTDEDGWKPIELFDGTNALVPHNFNFTVEPGTGDWLMHPQGDRSAPPSARMPAGGNFFDAIVRQPPIDEDRLDPADNCEEFGPLGPEALAHYASWRDRLSADAGAGTVLMMPGTAFGDIALVPAPFLKHPKGIRDIEEWYVSTAIRRDYIRAIFERQLAFAEANLATLAAMLGDLVQVVMVTGTDFGTQSGSFVSVDDYRDLFKPFHAQANRIIHRTTPWKSFIHSCGSNRDLLPEFIDAGFDIFNPVQCSAARMDPRELKKEFGRHLVFWGGGVDTQKTLAFGSPAEVYREVRERIDIFAPGGGFVFNAVHNVQANVPLANVEAMFRALDDARGIAGRPA
jgi:hypothetical protein